MVQIIPAILATDEQQYSDQVEKIKSCVELEGSWIHIDFMDNKFVPNQSIEASVVGKYPLNLDKEAHLMMEDPNIAEFIDQGFKRIIMHVEVEDLSTSLEMTKGKGIEVGLAIKLETPLSEIDKYLKDVDEVLVMSIEPGFQGQEFKVVALDRIKELVKIRAQNGSDFKIAVDGGVHTDTISGIIDAGADILIIGSALLEGDVTENIESIWEAAYN